MRMQAQNSRPAWSLGCATGSILGLVDDPEAGSEVGAEAGEGKKMSRSQRLHGHGLGPRQTSWMGPMMRGGGEEGVDCVGAVGCVWVLWMETVKSRSAPRTNTYSGD